MKNPTDDVNCTLWMSNDFLESKNHRKFTTNSDNRKMSNSEFTGTPFFHFITHLSQSTRPLIRKSWDNVIKHSIVNCYHVVMRL